MGESGGLRRRAPADQQRCDEYDQDIRPHYPSLEHRLFCFFHDDSRAKLSAQRGKVQRSQR
jgi:hypothetical protein